MVYLPPGYDDPANQGHHYPVIYLLSGAPGSQKEWFTDGAAARAADAWIDAGKLQPLILVSPDGNGGRYLDSQFVNSYDGRSLVETFLTRDVISYIDGHFRTIHDAGGRALVGYSAGAYGALNVGLHHPDLYSVLAGFSGYYTADPREVTSPAINHPMSNDPAFLRYNSPSVTITTLQPGQYPHIYLIDSTVDGVYTAATRQFDAELTRLKVPHVTALFTPRTAAERESWPHSWPFLQMAFQQYLPRIASTLQGG
jgi:S-formylglutathione hydrolase FrmB